LGLGRYIARRILLLLVVLFGLLSLTFIVSHIIPSDPAHAWAGEKSILSSLDVIRKRYHLDQPLWLQYILYFEDLLHGNLGISPVTNRPVFVDLVNFFPATLELSLVSLVLVMGIGIPLGVVSAIKRNKLLDHLLRIFSLTGVAMPIFWLAIMLQLIFYFELGWLPVGGRIGVPWTPITGFALVDTLITGNLVGFVDAVKHMILPASVLAFYSVGFIVRITRSSMLESLGTDYVRTARSKGVPENAVVLRHALKNALIPPITALGYTFGNMLQGAVITETVFSLPGLGTYAAGSITNLDFPAIMGFTIVAGISVAIVNLFIDMLYFAIDPRIKSAEGA
jgi:peptide/nickel transport system permease protein